jgi:glucose/arabinose dehydrogenase
MDPNKIDLRKIITVTSIIILVSVALASVYFLEIIARTANGTDTDKADDSEDSGKGSMNQYYLCTVLGDIVHCDPSLSALRSFEVRGQWTEVHRPSGKPIFVEGKYGRALLLEGEKRGESVEINNTESINPKNFSISFWIKKIPDSQSTGAILSHSNNDNDAGWDFVMSENGTISFEITDSSGKNNTTVSNRELSNGDNFLQSDGFVHIVGTFNGSIGSIYSNGRLDEQRVYSGKYVANPGSPLKVGVTASSSGTLLWTGIIDDLALYNRTLDQDDVTRIYESSGSYHDRSVKGLISHWSFDNDLNDTAFSNFGNNGTMRTLVSSMAFTPDGRLFFSEKNTGQIRIMERGNVLNKPFATLQDSYVDAEQGMLGLTIDPLFEKNHYVYLYYTATTNNGNEIVNRLVRFTDANNTAKNKVILIDNIPAISGYHSGGAIAFGPDDKLYLGIGDATVPEFSQNPSVLLGKVLRIDRNGEIPGDNPIPNSPVYSLGHRNMFGIAFDNKSGFGLVAENGDDLYDEINLIVKGGNYGFPTLQPPNSPPEHADSALSVLPVRSYWMTPAPTQTIYYDGDRFLELRNEFLLGTFDGDIYALRFNASNRTIVDEKWIELGIYPYTAVIAIAASPVTGDIYFAGNSIYKLTSVDLSSEEQTVFPLKFNFSTENNKVDNVELIRRENASVLRFEIQTSNRTQTAVSEPILRMQIPKDLLDNIHTVRMIEEDKYKNNNTTQLKRPVEFTTAESATTTDHFIGIKYLPLSNYRIEILATNVNFDRSNQMTTKAEPSSTDSNNNFSFTSHD